MMNHRPRIAFISEHASPLALLGSEDAGGQNVYVDEMSRNLSAQGFDVDVFVRRDDRETPEAVTWSPGVRVVHLTAGPPRFMLKDEMWSYMGDFRDSLIEFAAGQPGGYDLIHGNFWMSGWVAAEARERLGIPAVQIFHALGATKRREQGKADTSPPDRIETERDVARRVDRIIAHCPSEEAELIEDYGVETAKLVRIPSGVNLARFRPMPQAEARRHLGLSPDEFVIVYVGRMLPRKDVRNIVRALARLVPDAPVPLRLLVVGGDICEPDPERTPEIGVLQDLADELGVADRIIFTGKRKPDELCFYYSAGDVKVTTPWYEPYGFTPLEAMACGRPVVGSAVGGIAFTILDGETGLLVPPRDPDALAAGLRYLIDNPEERRRMGRRGMARVREQFTWPVAARCTAALYRDLLTHAARRPSWTPMAMPAIQAPFDQTGIDGED